MLRESKTQVLVAGAGPVGLVTAILLSENGVPVEVVDQEQCTTTHSYACALHPRTLRLLDRLGVAKEVLKLGRRVDSIGFYDGPVRRAGMKLSELPGDFAFLVVLPQSAFEGLLEERLSASGSAQLHWNHRFTGLHREAGDVIATVDQLGESSKGYIVPSWDWVVEKSLRIHSRFLVGADGHGSVVRTSLGIEYEQFKGTESFAVYELELEEDPGSEVKVALGRTTSVFWPLPGNKCRWSFQFPGADELSDFPPKDRTPWRIVQPSVDSDIKREATCLIAERAPWFKISIRDVDWSTNVHFEHRLVKRFGFNGCWLAGDSAHQTGPVGMQSMNLGLSEAEDLAARMTDILHKRAAADALDLYNIGWQAEWRRMLGVEKGLKPGNETDPWIKERLGQILPCIPASGDDLKLLVSQIHLIWE